MTARPRRIWLHPLIGGTLGLIAQTLLGVRLGADLHTFFGSVALATLIASPLAAISDSLLELELLQFCIGLGIGAGWCVASSREALTPSILSDCLLILLAWLMCMVGMSALLTRLFRDPTLGSATTTALALAWLTAPIWLGTHAQPIVKFHPLFAMNVSLIDLGTWTEQSFEYRYLFSLGQDVPYLLPATIWMCVGLHAFIGFLSLAAEFSPQVFGHLENQDPRTKVRG